MNNFVYNAKKAKERNSKKLTIKIISLSYVVQNIPNVTRFSPYDRNSIIVTKDDINLCLIVCVCVRERERERERER